MSELEHDLNRVGSKIAFVPRVGHCKIDNVPSFIRKIDIISDDNIIVCYFKGKNSGQICERIKDFLKRDYAPS